MRSLRKQVQKIEEEMMSNSNYSSRFTRPRFREAMMWFICLELDRLPVNHFDKKNYGVYSVGWICYYKENHTIIFYVVVVKLISKVVQTVKVGLFFKRHESAFMWNEIRVEDGHRAWTGPNFAWKMDIARAWKGPHRRPSRSGDEGFQDGAQGPPPSRSDDECEGELYNFILSSSRFGRKEGAPDHNIYCIQVRF